MTHRTIIDRDRRVKFWLYAPVVIWAGLIFFLSSGAGSSDETSRFIRPLLHFLFPSAPESVISVYHYYIRKAAHFTEYAVFAGLVARAVLASRYRGGYWPVIAILITAAVASCDEFYQSFNPARTSSPYDVLLDVSGGAFTVALIWIIRGRIMPRQPSE